MDLHKITGKQLVNLAVSIFKEIAQRKTKGKMEWQLSTEDSTDAYKTLWDQAKKQLSKEQISILEAESTNKDVDLLFEHDKLHTAFNKDNSDPELLFKHESIVKQLKDAGYEHRDIDLLDRFCKATKAPMHDSGQSSGEKITKDEILKHLNWEYYPIRKLLMLVGSIVTEGSSDNDVDVLFQGSREEMNSRFGRIATFKFLRAFPEKYWKRFRFHPADEFSGPIDEYIPIIDLVGQRINKNNQVYSIGDTKKAKESTKQQAKKAEQNDRITLGEFFTPLKPVRGYRSQKLGTIKIFADMIEKFPVWSSKKLDGQRGIIHKIGNEIIIFSDDGNRIEKQLPKICDKVKSLKAEELILDTEIETYKDKKHLPREETISRISSTKIEDDILIASIFDILWYKGNLPENIEQGDIHNIPFETRYKILDNLNFPQKTEDVPDVEKRLNIIPHHRNKDKDSLISETKRLSNLEGSEGNVAKQQNFKYNLSGTRSGMIKYHVNFDIVVTVLARKPTATEGVYNYDYGLKSGDYNNENDIVKIGTSYSTTKKLDKGDNFILEGETMNITSQEDKISASIYAPRFIEPTDRKIDTIKQAIDKAENENCLVYKKKEDNEIIYKAKTDSFMTYTEEQCKYVIHAHYRGQTVHLDLRIADIIKNKLVGWTIAAIKDEAINEPVKTIDQAKAINKNIDKWKINWKTGKFKERRKESGDIAPTQLYATQKVDEPDNWLDFEGISEPGGPGATKNYPGVFTIIDKGKLYIGAHKSYFHEYFITEGKLKGRLVFVKRGSDEKKAFHKALPPSEEKTKGTYWNCIQPVDQRPYVLGARAKSKGWVPPYNHSALPKPIKDSIPEKFRYWNIKDKNKRIEIRNQLIDHLKETDKYNKINKSNTIMERISKILKPLFSTDEELKVVSSQVEKEIDT